MKSPFICPVCHKILKENDKSLFCENNHLYDKSKYGYVNLLMSNKSSLSHHGDDKNMVLSRTNFLNLGYYEKLANLVCDLAKKYTKDGYSICDIGCGEGYYTSKILSVLNESYTNLSVTGIDISKDSLKTACKRCRDAKFAVASAYKLPYATSSQNLIINMFAPFSFDEFYRIANDNCYMIRVFPDENHLFELKEAIYDEPYKNEISSIDFENFDLIEEHHLTYIIHLKNNDEVKSLFDMTPYSYKTSREDIVKIDKIDKLDTTVDFKVIVYKLKNK